MHVCIIVCLCVCARVYVYVYIEVIRHPHTLHMCISTQITTDHISTSLKNTERVLEELRVKALSEKVVRIQARVRAWLARTRYLRVKGAVVVIQVYIP